MIRAPFLNFEPLGTVIVDTIIVNDSPSLVEIYKSSFEGTGLRVVASFPSLNESLSYFQKKNLGEMEKNAPEVKLPVVILLDHRALWRNEEILGKIKVLEPGTKVILVTPKDPSKFRYGGKLIDDAIQKPFTLSELVGSIRKITSLIRAKGTTVSSDPEEMYRLFSDALSDSNNEVCICLSSTGIARRIAVPNYTPMYLKARPKGLQVRLITEITKDNMSTCRELVVRHGVQLRHLEGMSQNLSIYDNKHFFQAALLSADSTFLSQIIYSNLEPIVAQNQYMFDELWKIAKPGIERIQEIEASMKEEATLFQRNANYKTMIETAAEGILLTEPEGKISLVNKRLSEMLGYSVEEVLDKPSADFVVNEEQSGQIIQARENLHQGKVLSGELRLRRRDGSVLWTSYNASPIYDENGVHVSNMSMYTDITEKKKIERALERQAALIDLSPDAIMIRNFGGTISFWSKGAEKLYGYTSSEALGNMAHLLLKTKFPKPVEEIESDVRLKGRWIGELLHSTKNGKELTVKSQWVLNRSRDEDGNKIENVLEWNMDITAELKESEKELAKHERCF